MAMRKIGYLLLLTGILLASCAPNNVKQDASLKKYFDENKVNGCFALLANGTNEFTIYNLERYRDSAFAPASTFKIVNALIGLQTGVITSADMVIKWDGITRPVDAWNHDLTMYDAFRASAVPYFQEVARRIGKDTMEAYLNRIRYGARSDSDRVMLTSPIDTFWLDNSLKITPDQQLGLIKNLYFEKVPGIYTSYQKTVKNAMLFENNTNYKLSYKTGWLSWSPQHPSQLAWITGWIEENGHPYFFVLNFETPDKNADIPTIRMKMLKDILRHLGFLEGKM